MIERAPAKVNLCLFVGGRRPSDGRHELVSVMQAIDLCDDLRLTPGPKVPGTFAPPPGPKVPGPKVPGTFAPPPGPTVPGTDGPRDEVVCVGVEGPNLVAEAIAAFRARTGWDGPPVRIEVAKRIPVAAGLGGGSADAAAALRLLARAHERGQTPLMRDELLELAAGLGADVPAQVRPGRYLAEGAGERVEALPPVWPSFAVLVVPGEAALATADVYREFDRLGLPRSAADLDGRRAEVRARVVAGRTGLPDALVVNDLGPAAISLLPSIAGALADAREAGADHALVSGSGPTVLGLFVDPGAARTAAQALRRHHPRLVLTEPVHAT